MFKCQENQVAVLGICVDAPATSSANEDLNYHAALNGRRAIDMLRMVSFDMVLVGMQIPDMSTWDFLRHLKTAFPNQKWVLVGGPVSEQQEIRARTFGCSTLFDSTPSSNELLQLTSRIRQQAMTNALKGKFERPASARRSQIRSV